MKVEVFAICYNEEFLIPFFMRHYNFAFRVNIFDNHSTDRSRAIAKRLGANVLTFGRKQLDDREYLKIKNEVYKTSKADYVIVCDLDEFIYHPNIIQHLTELKEAGITMPAVKGFNIYSNNLPKNNILEIDTGFEDKNFGKQAIFSPKIDINFSYGCHKNRARGPIKRGGDLKLLHYRCIGGVQKMIYRHSMYSQRMCEFNISRGLGVHYLRTPEQLHKEFERNMKKAKKLLFLSNV